MRKAFALLPILLALAPACAQEVGDLPGAWAALEELRSDRHREHRLTVRRTQAMVQLFMQAGEPCAAAESHLFAALSLTELGTLDSALAVVERARGILASNPCSAVLTARLHLAQANFKSAMGMHSDSEADCRAGLLHTDVLEGQPGVRTALLLTLGSALGQQHRFREAEGCFQEAYRAAVRGDHERNISDALSNIGVIKYFSGELDSASHYFLQALRQDLALGNYRGACHRFSNLSAIAEELQDHRQQLAYADSALKYALLTGELGMLVKVADVRAEAFSHLGDHRNAYLALREHGAFNDSLMNVERLRAITEMQEKYESERKAREILGLQARTLEADLDRSRALRTRNIYLFIGLGVLVLAVGLWNRLRFVHRSRAEIQREKEVNEELLHNILPVEVAQEIRQKGRVTVRQFTTATVLFTDFKGFTSLAEQLAPAALVEEIDHCFSAFDGMMAKYGIEKIKTIGDAYMAAGGLPVPSDESVKNTVLAALEMQRFIRDRKGHKEALGEPAFEMRVGIHTGPVVAGVVGVKKFQYDLWGDTVNTASRMESHGVVDRVNISESTYRLLMDDPQFLFSSRGKVEAKGKGELEMFLVQEKEASMVGLEERPFESTSA
jgi:adenylate cyclase